MIYRARVSLVPALPLAVVLGLGFLAVLAPIIAAHHPTQGSLPLQLLPPVWMEGGRTEYLLGTDLLGRDVLTRLMYGARVSLSISLISILLSGSLGTLLGLVSGYYGGQVDMLIMRLTDVGLSVPFILMAILLAVVFGPSYASVVLIVLLLLWPRFARQIRGEALAVKEQDFVALAKIAGKGSWTIIWRHIFPNVLPTVLVLVTFEFAHVIILESTLSFLGVGIAPPTPSWGLMVAEGRGLITTAWWLPIFPGAVILLAVLSINVLGDWLRDRLDPKLQGL